MKLGCFYIVTFLLLQAGHLWALPVTSMSLGEFETPEQVVVLPDGRTVNANEKVVVTNIVADGSVESLDKALDRAVGDLNSATKWAPNVPFEIIVLPGELTEYGSVDKLSRGNQIQSHSWKSGYKKFQNLLLANQDIAHRLKRKFVWEEAFLYDSNVSVEEVPEHLQGIYSLAARIHPGQRVIIGKTKTVNFRRLNFTLAVVKSFFQGALLGVTAFVIADSQLAMQSLQDIVTSQSLLGGFAEVRDLLGHVINNVKYIAPAGIMGALGGVIYYHGHILRQFYKFEAKFTPGLNPKKWIQIDTERKTQTWARYLSKQSIVTGGFILTMQTVFSLAGLIEPSASSVMAASFATVGSLLSGLPFSRMFIERTDGVSIARANSRMRSKVIRTNIYSLLVTSSFIVSEAMALFTNQPEILTAGRISFGIIGVFGYSFWFYTSKTAEMAHLRSGFKSLLLGRIDEAREAFGDFLRVVKPFGVQRQCRALFSY